MAGNNLLLKTWVAEKNKPFFFTNMCLSYYMKTKKMCLWKKRLLCDFGFFGQLTQTGLFHRQIISLFDAFCFVKTIFEHRSKFAIKKRKKKVLPQICILSIENCISHNFHLQNCVMICIFCSILFWWHQICFQVTKAATDLFCSSFKQI